MEWSRAWGTVGCSADQGRRFERVAVERKRQRGRRPGKQVGAQVARRGRGRESEPESGGRA